jgi:hypothetical protein
LRNIKEATAVTVRICPQRKTRQAMYILVYNVTLRRVGEITVTGEK